MAAAAFPSLFAVQVRALADSLQGELPGFAQKGLQVAGVLLVAIIALRLLRVLSGRIIKAVDDGNPDTFTAAEQRGHTLAQLLNSVGTVAIAIAAGLTILNFFVPIGPLLAGVGVAGLAISFGAQSLVKDVISGFFILMENQFSVGDVIQVDGVSGGVERMTLRVVMLRDVNGVLHTIPNGSITRVSNMTKGWARTVVDVGVAYEEQVDRVIHVLRDVAADLGKDPRWKLDLTAEPAVWGVEALGSDAVIVRIVASTRAGRQWDVGRELRRRIKNQFDKEGITIPFPQRTVHLGDAPALFKLLADRNAKEAKPGS
ncbi:MAG: mechanosensitive ion channel family protein [Gemmatimonadetes bacterium]|nr:mechanosensitive ion channel family protein [Gemmatimonadota bacterium]